MANSSAKFDNETPPMSEAEAGPINMGEVEEPSALDSIDSRMDLDEPRPNQTEIKFDDTGQMVEADHAVEPPGNEDALVNVLEPAAVEETKLKQEDIPNWFEPYAESQKKMAEYFEWQRGQQEQYKVQQRNYAESQQEAYFRSPEYITQVCDLNQLDSEDPVHRRMVETELRSQHEKQKYEERLSRLESATRETAVNKQRMTAQEKLASSFEEVASTYDGVSSELVEAAKNQAVRLAGLGVAHEEAITESLQFVRMAAKSPPEARRAASQKQTRIDQLNSAGPGRGARSHRKPDGMSMADADMLVSRGGFFPN